MKGRVFLPWAALVVAGVWLGGCGKIDASTGLPPGGTPSTNPPPTTQGGPRVASIEVTPATATVQVGQIQPYSYVVRDSAGNVLNNVAVTWTMTPPTVATIDPAGMAVGKVPGVALLVASASGAVSTPVTLTVKDAPPCGGAYDAKSWAGTITFRYGFSAADPTSAIDVDEHAELWVRLDAAGPGTWVASANVGSLDGGVGMNSKTTSIAPDGSKSVTWYTAADQGPLLTANGVPASGVVMKVDPVTCNYSFEAGAWGNVTVKDGQLAPYTAPSGIGALRIAPRPTHGMATLDAAKHHVDGHAMFWNDQITDAYFPSAGLPPGVLIFGYWVPAQSKAAEAIVGWTLTPR